MPLGWPLWIVLLFLFVYGTVIGSFLNVCIYRIPKTDKFWASLRGLTSPPSSCPNCKNRIPAQDNIPIFGWLKLGGRCRFCKTPISIRYPLIELLNGLLFVVVYWFEIPSEWGMSIADSCLFDKYGPQGFEGSTWLSPLAVLHWRYLYHMVLIEALVVATFIDFDLKIIPDGSTLPAMVVGIIGAGVVGQVHIVPLWFQDPSIMRTMRLVFPDWTHAVFNPIAVPAWFAQYPHLHGLLVSLAGFLVGGGTIWAVRIIGFWVLRQEAMGFGDVILMAMIGSFVGWQPVFVIFFVAPICALAVVIASWFFRRNREIPYGPYLSLATLITIVGWNHVWPVAERVFSLGPMFFVLTIIMVVLFFVTLQLAQMVKRLFGIPLYPEDEIEEWTSADHLFHYAGEIVDQHQGRWRTNARDEWSGTLSGRGTLQDETWRRGYERGSHHNWKRND